MLVIHVIYFASVFIDCRGPCNLEKPGEEPLCIGINKIDSRQLDYLAAAYGGEKTDKITVVRSGASTSFPK